LNVVPESQLIPTQFSVRFIVSADGASDSLSQTQIAVARIRALPNRQIHLTARLRDVSGPSGAAPAAVIEWSGSPLNATGGAMSATCTSGSFASAPSQEMVEGWPSSGTLTCRVAFTLANPRALPPGPYTASFDLTLHAD
jgi:hypothetical protein